MQFSSVLLCTTLLGTSTLVSGFHGGLGFGGGFKQRLCAMGKMKFCPVVTPTTLTSPSTSPDTSNCKISGSVSGSGSAPGPSSGSGNDGDSGLGAENITKTSSAGAGHGSDSGSNTTALEIVPSPRNILTSKVAAAPVFEDEINEETPGDRAHSIVKYNCNHRNRCVRGNQTNRRPVQINGRKAVRTNSKHFKVRSNSRDRKVLKSRKTLRSRKISKNPMNRNVRRVPRVSRRKSSETKV